MPKTNIICTECFHRIGFVILFKDSTFYVEGIELKPTSKLQVVCEQCQRKAKKPS